MTTAAQPEAGRGRVALVTAGGSGMGAGAARALATQGYGIGILSSSGRGEALAAELGGVGITGSNRSTEDLRKLVDAALDRWGRIDVLVNSAGHGPKGGIIEMTDEDWAVGMDIYLLNVVRPTRLVAPVMADGGGGAIINISSFAAVEPDAAFPTSAVFRAGLSAFTKLFAREWAARNVRMNNVLPGFVDSLPEKAERRETIPLGRYGRAEEVSSLVAYLASDAAAYITGQNLVIDGGLTRGI